MGKAFLAVLVLLPALPAAAEPPAKPAIHARAEWAAAPAGAIVSDPDKVRIVVHHADILVTEEMKKLGPAEGWKAAARYARDVQSLHKRVNGWSDIGYHYLVDWEGRILQGRPVDLLGAHTEGANEGSIGVALMGNLQDQHPTAKQLAGLKALLAWLTASYGISPEAIHGHHDYNATACPGFYLENQKDPNNPLRRIRLQLLAERRHELKSARLAETLQRMSAGLPLLFGAPAPRIP